MASACFSLVFFQVRLFRFPLDELVQEALFEVADYPGIIQ